LQRRSQSKGRTWTRGVAELYSALVLVAATLALSYLVFSQVKFPATAQPVYVASMTQRFGSPSVLRLLVNSSSSSSAAEFRVDDSSSVSGVLALVSGGYTASSSLCGAGITTFFSVYTGAGLLSVSVDGTASIDGIPGASETVAQGWHELMISNSSRCEVTLPGGASLGYPSSLVSTIPFTQPTPQSFAFLVPFTTSGHTITIALTGGVETYGF